MIRATTKTDTSLGSRARKPATWHTMPCLHVKSFRRKRRSATPVIARCKPITQSDNNRCVTNTYGVTGEGMCRDQRTGNEAAHVPCQCQRNKDGHAYSVDVRPQKRFTR